MIKRFGCNVHAFDPTPRSIAWVSQQSLPEEFIFHPLGISDHDGTLEFFEPRREESFNYSSIKRDPGRRNHRVIQAPVKRLSTIMQELGHERLDILKIDIEGGEYPVLDDVLAAKIPVGQLLIEFHHNFKSVGVNRTVRAVDALRAAGFRLFFLSNRTYEMSFIHTSLLPDSTPD